MCYIKVRKILYTKEKTLESHFRRNLEMKKEIILAHKLLICVQIECI